MVLSTLADAERFENDGFSFRPLAVPSRGSTEIAIWLLEGPSGAVSSVHSMSREEVFVVQSGTLVAALGGDELVVNAGEVLIVPAGQVLQVRSAGSEPLRALAVTSVGMLGTIGDKTFEPPWAR